MSDNLTQHFNLTLGQTFHRSHFVDLSAECEIEAQPPPDGNAHDIDKMRTLPQRAEGIT